MIVKGITVKYTLVFLLIAQELATSSALLYIVRQNCTRGSVFTPVPSTVNNICLQCVCIMPNISYCKILIVQLSIICSAAITVAVTAAPTTTTTTRPPTVTLTVPTIPAATVTTSIGINPRASSPAAAAMMNATPNTLMVSGSPMMMMMMAAAGTAAMSMSAATMTPAPAG